MIKKLYKNEYGSTPRSDKGLDTAAPEAPSKPAIETAKAKEPDKKSDISDNYEDSFDDSPGLIKGKEADKKEAKKESDDDEWGLEGDWGENEPIDTPGADCASFSKSKDYKLKAAGKVYSALQKNSSFWQFPL